MGEEEAAFVVDEQFVEFGVHVGGVEAEGGGNLGEEALEVGDPTAAAEVEVGGGDLPDLAHGFVGERLVAFAVGGALASARDEAAGLVGWDGEGNGADAGDGEGGHGGLKGAGGEVVAGAFDGGEGVYQRSEGGGVGHG